MKKIIYGNADFEQQLQSLYDRPAFPPAAEEAARQIIAGVKERGNAALTEYAEKFDHAKLSADEFFMPLAEAKKIASTLPAADKRAIRQALKQITTFAKLTPPRTWMKTIRPGVKAGEKLTEGQVSPKELLEVAGVLEVQNYILKEVKRVYQSQGIEISDKHIEVMIRQMLRKVVILEGNDTGLNAGQQISINQLNKINTRVLMDGKMAAKFAPVLLGISKASVETDSFLSAASFQETTKVLTDAALRGKVDELAGLKENVLIGKLIPAGTGTTYERESTYQVEELAAELRAKRLARNKKEEDDEEEFDVVAQEVVEVDEIDDEILDDEFELMEDIGDDEE